METKNILIILLSLLMLNLFAKSTVQQHDRAQELRVEAADAYAQHQYQRAINKYIQLKEHYISSLPLLKQLDVYLGLGVCYYKTKQYARGTEIFSEANIVIENNKLWSKLDVPTPYYSLWGKCLIGLKKYQEAEKVFIDGIDKISHSHANVYAGVGLLQSELGDLCLDTENYTSSIKYYESALSNTAFVEHQSTNVLANLYYSLSAAYYHDNNLSKALLNSTMCMKYAEKNTDMTGLAYTSKAMILYKQGKINEAIELLKTADKILTDKYGKNHRAAQRIAHKLRDWIK